MALFPDQTFLVTGASGGVGAAIARALGREGASVCLGGRDQGKLAQVAADLPAGKGHCYPADLAEAEQLEASAAKVRSEHPRLDGLIHCAAIIVLDEVAAARPEDFERQFKINVEAPFRLTQLFLPDLKESGGQVIFMNSSVGLEARAGLSQYAATKHALKALADSLRDECNAEGVRVCSIFLGATATPMQAEVRTQLNREYRPDRLIQPDDVAALVTSVLGIARTAEVTDVMMRPMMKS